MEGKELDKPNNIVAVSLEQRRMRACGPMKRRMPAIVTVIACRNDLEIPYSPLFFNNFKPKSLNFWATK